MAVLIEMANRVFPLLRQFLQGIHISVCEALTRRHGISCRLHKNCLSRFDEQFSYIVRHDVKSQTPCSTATLVILLLHAAPRHVNQHVTQKGTCYLKYILATR
eukprot:6198518-Pleurochrysis_carterae.AAC.3